MADKRIILFPGSLDELNSRENGGDCFAIVKPDERKEIPAYLENVVRDYSDFLRMMMPQPIERADNQFLTILQSMGYEGVIRYSLIPNASHKDTYYHAQGIPIKRIQRYAIVDV